MKRQSNVPRTTWSQESERIKTPDVDGGYNAVRVEII